MTPERWSRLKELFDDASSRQGNDRAEFLATAAVTDPELAEEVRALMENHRTADSLFDQPLVSRERMVEYLSRGARVFETGEVICRRFRIEGLLGEGGMGVVYAATDLELGEPVAVKTLHEGISGNPRMLARFKQEVQLSRRVTHPNVCRIFDLFQHERGDGMVVAFVTMELLEGETLAQRIRRQGRMAAGEAVALARQMTGGLGAAHRAGIVHGDFKSGNVMLVEVAGRGQRVVITDFGLAREYDAFATDVQEVRGTPAYIAPEQLEGKPLTPACDIYALGVVLYETVTGRLPFEGGNALAVAEQRLRQAAPAVRAAAGGLGGAWDTAIQRCLERDPARRPGSPAAVMDILENRAGRRRWLAGIASAAGVALLVGRRLTAPRVWASEAVKSYKRGEEFARRRTKEGLENAVQEYGRAVAVEPEYADAWAGMAAAWAALGQFRFADAKVALPKAKEAARRAIGIDAKCGRAHGVLAYCMSIDLHEWLKAEPYFQSAISLSPNDPDVRLWYAAYLGKRGRAEEAIQQIRSGLERDPTSLVLNLQLASEYFLMGRQEDLRRQANELLRLQPFEAMSHVMLARSLEMDGRYDDALKSCDDADLYGHRAAAVTVRGSIYASRGDVVEARRIAAVVEKAWRENPYTESLLLAGLYCKLGERQKALDVLFGGFERSDPTLLMVPTHPYLKPLEGEPRYREFLRRLGLEG